jgi:glycosyltransferase involved in cell wall biosynthesis
MNILIFNHAILPVSKYGGTERIVWWLGKELSRQGHGVTFLAKAGTKSDFAKVLIYNPAVSINQQIPDYIDVVHLDHQPSEPISKPYITMISGNINDFQELDRNTVFVSKNHANRFQSEAFVYNGLDLSDYDKPTFSQKRGHLHFLAKAAWRVKNIKGAIAIARKGKQKLVVLGGTRLNIKMGFRFTPYPNIQFYGMLGGEKKNQLLNASKALLFPVLWHEPFGIALIESLYMGAAVLGTPYGSLPELIIPEVGFLSNKQSELVNQISHIADYDNRKCHEYVADSFTIRQTAEGYLRYYEVVLNKQNINKTSPKLIEQVPKFLTFYD